MALYEWKAASQSIHRCLAGRLALPCALSPPHTCLIASFELWTKTFTQILSYNNNNCQSNFRQCQTLLIDGSHVNPERQQAAAAPSQLIPCPHNKQLFDAVTTERETNGRTKKTFPHLSHPLCLHTPLALSSFCICKRKRTLGEHHPRWSMVNHWMGGGSSVEGNWIYWICRIAKWKSHTFNFLHDTDTHTREMAMGELSLIPIDRTDFNFKLMEMCTCIGMDTFCESKVVGDAVTIY